MFFRVFKEVHWINVQNLPRTPVDRSGSFWFDMFLEDEEHAKISHRDFLMLSYERSTIGKESRRKIIEV